MALLFVCAWGIGALVLGAAFARNPDRFAERYIRAMARTDLSRKLQQRLAPRWAILVWYRAGGIVFMILGVTMPVLALTGVLPT